MFSLVAPKWQPYLLLIFALFAGRIAAQDDFSTSIVPLSMQSPSLVPLVQTATYSSLATETVTFEVDKVALDNATYRIWLQHFDAYAEQAEDNFTTGLPSPDVTFAWAQCWYPLSSFYFLLPRALLYVVLLFAIVAQQHDWIIIGALAAGMTYTSVVAVHAIIMTWSGHAYGNVDFGAAVGILSFSAAVVVPLLTWSKKIKDIGRSRGDDAAGRSFILYWSLLVFVALMSQVIALWTIVAHSHGHLHDALETTLGGYISVNASTDSVTCSPSSGVMNLSAGQNHGFFGLIMSQEFVKNNSCHNPCQQISYEDTHWATTRSFDELEPMTEKALRTLYYPLPEGDPHLEYKVKSIDAFFSAGTAFISVILAQGIIAIFTGRRYPFQLRNVAYSKLKPKESHSTFGKTGRTFAQLVGLSLQAAAWLSSIVSIVLIPLAIVMTEFVMVEFDQPYNFWVVDQWGPWVSTGVVIAGALLYKCQIKLRGNITEWQGQNSVAKRPEPSTKDSDPGTLVERRTSDKNWRDMYPLFLRPGEFWKTRWDNIVNFWKDPDYWSEKDKGEWGLNKSGTEIEREKSQRRQSEKV